MAEKKLSGVKVLMVIAQEQFRDEELLEPKEILEEAGAMITVASTKEGEAHGMLGTTVTADTVIDRVNSGDYHAIVVVGGMGSPEFLWNNAVLHKLLQQCQKDGKVVAGICLSGAALAKAGVLASKNATVWATEESLQALEAGQARYSQEHVVADGNIITADGPQAAGEFGQALLSALQKVRAKV